MEHKINELEDHDVSSTDEHDGMKEDIVQIKIDMAEHGVYLKQILTHLKIPYK